MNLFASVGNVGSESHELFSERPKVAGGSGLRILIDQRDSITVRLDVGVTTEGDSAVYLALGEAF